MHSSSLTLSGDNQLQTNKQVAHTLIFFPVTPQQVLRAFGNTGQDTPEMLSLAACCFQHHFILCCLHRLIEVNLKKWLGFDSRFSDLI